MWLPGVDIWGKMGTHTLPVGYCIQTSASAKKAQRLFATYVQHSITYVVIYYLL